MTGQARADELRRQAAQVIGRIQDADEIAAFQCDKHYRNGRQDQRYAWGKIRRVLNAAETLIGALVNEQANGIDRVGWTPQPADDPLADLEYPDAA